MSNRVSRDKSLEAQGWKRQFIANEPRLTEAVEMYRELGFEVLLEPLSRESGRAGCEGTEGREEDECRVCFQGVEEQCKIIYTRPYRKEDG